MGHSVHRRNPEESHCKQRPTALLLEPGLVEAGASITRIGCRNPTWSVARLNHVFGSHARVEEIAELAELSGLAAGFRESARAALEAATGTNRRALSETESE